MTISYPCKETTSLDVALSSPLVLKGQWAHFLSLVCFKGGPAAEFHGFKNEDTFLFISRKECH